MKVISRTLVLAALLRSSAAVLVTEGSQCEQKCGNVPTSTADDEVVCRDSDYSTSAGLVWQSCLTCESTSPYKLQSGKTTHTDLEAMLCRLPFRLPHSHQRYFAATNDIHLHRQHAIRRIGVLVRADRKQPVHHYVGHHHLI